MPFKPTFPQTLAGIKDVPTYETSRIIRDALNTLLGAFGTEYAVISPAAANTDFTIQHNLGRTVTSWLVVSKSAACDVYLGSVTGNENQLTLRATVASVTLKLVLL